MTAANRHRLLYHYTALANVESIFRSGELRTSRVPAGALRLGRGLEVVWLTDATDPGRGGDHGLAVASDDPALDKRGVRFTVAVSDAQYWRQWAVRRHVSQRTRRVLHEAGGRLSARWWVVPRPIQTDEWMRVDDLATGERLWPNPEAQPIAGFGVA